MNLVADASVAFKWLFEEVDSAKARRLLELAREDVVRLIAPEIIFAEIANAVWKRVQRGELQPEEAVSNYSRFESVCPAPVRISLLAEGALAVALRYSRSVYDGLYVTLALQARCDFVTADTKLYHALSAEFRQVKLLHEWHEGGQDC